MVNNGNHPQMAFIQVGELYYNHDLPRYINHTLTIYLPRFFRCLHHHLSPGAIVGAATEREDGAAEQTQDVEENDGPPTVSLRMGTTMNINLISWDIKPNIIL